MNEIRDGESFIANVEPEFWRQSFNKNTILMPYPNIIRVTQVVKINITRPSDNKVLVEIKKTKDNKEKTQTPSEKIKGNETPEEAANRGIEEELTLFKNTSYTLTLVSTENEITPSDSYNGFSTLFTLYKYDLDGDIPQEYLVDRFDTNDTSNMKTLKWRWI